MDIGDAVQAMNEGLRVRRAGWNGKGMYLYKDTGSEYEPFVVIKTADNKFQPGWLCSQQDLFALDWEIVESI